MKTAVIYARYSSDSQTEQSIEGQVRVCKQFAEKNDLLVVDQYIDRATTGTNDNRAAFQQMLRDSKKAKWGAVIVYKLDRFARNKYESVVNRKKLKDNGVELVSAMENIPDTPEGKLFLAVIEGFNEYFSEDLKQKVNRGLRESWLKGNATGGHPPYGYVIKDKKYVIDEAEAEVVREIFMKYAQGYKAVSIAEDLKARNVRRKCGKHINHKYVYVILHDKRYIGEVTHQGTTYYNIFPPIIAKEVWNQVDAINQENKISPSRKKEIFDYILSGKLICGNCKHRMSGESGTSRNGEIHYYYVCLSKRRGKADCDCKAVKKQELEDYVIDATVSMLQRNSIITKIAETIVKVHEKIMRDNSGLQILIKKREEAKRAADNIVKAIEQGIIMDFTKDRLAALQDELNRLDIEINKESQKTYAHVTVEDVEKYLLSMITCHALRRNFCTWLYAESGVETEEIYRQMGHEDKTVKRRAGVRGLTPQELYVLCLKKHVCRTLYHAPHPLRYRLGGAIKATEVPACTMELMLPPGTKWELIVEETEPNNQLQYSGNVVYSIVRNDECRKEKYEYSLLTSERTHTILAKKKLFGCSSGNDDMHK